MAPEFSQDDTILKDVKKSFDSKNKNNLVYSNPGKENRKKNKTSGNKIYKRKGVNKKIEKNIKFTGNNRKYVNYNDESEEISSYNNTENNIEINNDSVQQNTKQEIAVLLNNVNETYDKESKKNNVIFIENYSDNDINEVNQIQI